MFPFLRRLFTAERLAQQVLDLQEENVRLKNLLSRQTYGPNFMAVASDFKLPEGLAQQLYEEVLFRLEGAFEQNIFRAVRAVLTQLPKKGEPRPTLSAMMAKDVHGSLHIRVTLDQATVTIPFHPPF